MNKLTSVFAQTIQIFSRNEFHRAVIETKADRGKGIYKLVAICSDVVLLNESGLFIEGDSLKIKSFLGTSVNAVMIQISEH
ncbi:MAG: hypothetical protein SNJ53_08470 [Thermodesulfovibrionales bacterium]